MKQLKPSPDIYPGIALKEIDIDDVIKCTEIAFNIEFEVLKEITRKRNNVYMKAAFVDIVLNYTSIDISLIELGLLINRDHSSVIHYRNNLIDNKYQNKKVKEYTHKILEHMGFIRIERKTVKLEEVNIYIFSYSHNGENKNIDEFSEKIKSGIIDERKKMNELNLQSSVYKI